MAQYLMQARDSVTGEMYRWVAGTPDFAGSGYTGPNSADEVAVVASPGDVTGSPAPGLASVLANGSDANGSTITNLGAPAAPTSAVREQDVTLARALANDPDAGGAAARRLVLGSTAATTIPATAQNTAIGYSEDIGARRNTGSSAVGMQVFQRVSRSTFDTASLTLTGGGISPSDVPANCMIVAEADVVAVGSVRYAAKLTGTFQVAAGTITKLFVAVIGPPLPAELSDLLFSVAPSGTIGVRLVQASAGPSWTFATRTKFTVVEDPS